MKRIDDPALENVFGKKPLPDGTYVNVNYIDNLGGRSRISRRGLDIALENYEEEVPIVLYSFERLSELFIDRRFMKLMARRNVHFIRAPFEPENIEKLMSYPTFDNMALEIASDYLEEVDIIRTLKHDYLKNPSRTSEKARKKLGFDGNEKDLEDYLLSYDSFNFSKKNIKRIPGVFVDIENTFIKNSEVNPIVFKKMLEYCKSHCISLWTGGDYKNYTAFVLGKLHSVCKDKDTNLHMRTPLLSKHVFAGSVVEIVIDDLDQNNFEHEYGITPEKYIRIV